MIADLVRRAAWGLLRIFSTITTSTSGLATSYANSNKLDRCQNGVIWVLVQKTTTAEFWYSLNNGKTWTQDTGATITCTEASMFIDLDDYLHVSYTTSGDVLYKRGTPNAGRTVYTLSSSVEVFNVSGCDCGLSDLIAHRVGTGWNTGWEVHIVANVDNTSTTSTFVYYRCLTVSSAGVITQGTVTPLSSDHPAGLNLRPSIDFNHTGDSKTVAASGPHIFVGWSARTSGSGQGIRFRKAVADNISPPTIVTFAYTGSMQTYVVPAGVTSLKIKSYGAQGCTVLGGGLGGEGGYAEGILSVTPGENIYIFVGGAGTAGIITTGGGGGWNGGGDSYDNSFTNYSGGGGGASDVRKGGTALSDRKLIAAGGGGAGEQSQDGGDGGADTGEAGVTGFDGNTGGGGGTQSAGGVKGSLGIQGEDGSLGQGGKGGNGARASGAGGGGGYYGGGGSSGSDQTNNQRAGGGGGSNYTGGVTSPVSTRGGRLGNGQVVLEIETTGWTGWAWNTERAIDTTRYIDNSPLRWMKCMFDGIRVIMAGFLYDGSNHDLMLYERDLADTTTIARVLVNNALSSEIGTGAINPGSATFDRFGNVHYVGRTTPSTGVNYLIYRKWHRQTDTLSSPKTLDSTIGDAVNTTSYASFKRGYSKERLELVYTDGTASPFNIKFEGMDTT